MPGCTTPPTVRTCSDLITTDRRSYLGTQYTILERDVAGAHRAQFGVHLLKFGSRILAEAGIQLDPALLDLCQLWPARGIGKARLIQLTAQIVDLALQAQHSTSTPHPGPAAGGSRASRSVRPRLRSRRSGA